MDLQYQGINVGKATTTILGFVFKCSAIHYQFCLVESVQQIIFGFKIRLDFVRANDTLFG